MCLTSPPTPRIPAYCFPLRPRGGFHRKKDGVLVPFFHCPLFHSHLHTLHFRPSPTGEGVRRAALPRRTLPHPPTAKSQKCPFAPNSVLQKHHANPSNFEARQTQHSLPSSPISRLPEAHIHPHPQPPNHIAGNSMSHKWVFTFLPPPPSGFHI